MNIDDMDDMTIFVKYEIKYIENQVLGTEHREK